MMPEALHSIYFLLLRKPTRKTARALGFLGLGSLFLIISPKIRQNLLDGIGSVARQFELYAPHSYVAGVVLVLLIFMMSLYRGAQPR